jgi:hypothetical protein
MQRALSAHRVKDNRSNFPDWYQAVVREADMAETSPVRGSMIIKPWGYGIWEQIQKELDRRIKETGHDNCYFPLFIPLSFIAKEAQHVEGFAKEMAVVTHHRLKMIDGKLQPDPGREAGGAAGGAADLGDHHRRRLLALDQEPSRPAAADQPMGQCGALGNAHAAVSCAPAEFLWQEGPHRAMRMPPTPWPRRLRMLEGLPRLCRRPRSPCR